MSRPFPTAAVFLLSAFAFAATAQTHRVAPPEKVTRAVAVYEWTGDLAKPAASRLVPVSLFINGHFEDAGLYLARPVPFALETGDVYSIEQAGEEQGTFSVEHSRDFTTGRLLPDQEPVGAWYGFGRFTPLAPPPPPPALHASAHPAVIVSSSDSSRPHFGNKPPDATPAAKTSPSGSRDGAPSGSQDGNGKDPGSQDAGNRNGASSPGKASPGDDTDRPTLGRRRASDADAGTSGDSTAPGSTPAKDSDPERPSLRKRNPENVGKKSPPQAGVTGPARPLNDDPDRPTIRRGKTPAQEEASELKSLPADMHQVAGVSDPKSRDPHLFARAWDSPAERADTLSRLQTLARAEVAAYLTQNRLVPGPAAPAAPPAPAAAPTRGAEPSTDANAPTLRRTPGGVDTSTRRPSGVSPAAPAVPSPARPAAPHTAAGRRRPGVRAGTGPVAKAVQPPVVFTGEQLFAFTLSYGGLATFVYTAQVPVMAGGPVYVTLVAQHLPSGEFQVALRSVTDATHLDRTPWMRPVDAVDPDASHRASLLFELRAQSSRQFALYRLVSAKAEQQFVSSAIQ